MVFSNAELYERDFHAWTEATAAAIRDRRFDVLDAETLAQEIEDMGSRERRELGHRFSVLIAHLLKWQYQAHKRSSSWSDTIAVQRTDIADLLEESPSLRPRLSEILPKSYRRGVLLAAAETGFSARGDLPAECPWSVQQLLDPEFLPL